MVADVAYTASAWTDLFVATAGASAALTGLVFVAVSINIQEILKNAGLPARALQTVIMLMVPVVVSILLLIPEQSAATVGVEMLVAGSVGLVAVVTLAWRSLPPQAPRGWMVGRMLVAGLGTLPLVVGGISLLAGSGGGLYWIVAGTIGAIVGGVINAWVLLVEILR